MQVIHGPSRKPSQFSTFGALRFLCPRVDQPRDALQCGSPARTKRCSESSVKRMRAAAFKPLLMPVSRHVSSPHLRSHHVTSRHVTSRHVAFTSRLAFLSPVAQVPGLRKGQSPASPSVLGFTDSFNVLSTDTPPSFSFLWVCSGSFGVYPWKTPSRVVLYILHFLQFLEFFDADLVSPGRFTRTAKPPYSAVPAPCSGVWRVDS